jgi:hypothetical protein
MRSLKVAMAVSFMALLGLSGCNPSGPDPERYVLTGNDKNVFFQRQLAVDPKNADEIIATVRAFSREHELDFLLARESLPPGDFNVSVNGPSLNIAAMHTAAIGDTGVQVFAIVPKMPTAKDKELVADFVARVERLKGCGDSCNKPLT